MVTDKEIKDAFNEYMIKAHDIELDLYRKEILYARHEKIEMDEQPFNYGFQAGAKWMQEKMKEEKHKPWRVTPNICVMCGLNITTNGTDKSCGCDK